MYAVPRPHESPRGRGRTKALQRRPYRSKKYGDMQGKYTALRTLKTHCGGWWQSCSVFKELGKEWPSILFPASLAVLLHHWGYLVIFSKISLLIVSNLATPSVQPTPDISGNGPITLLISEQDYQERYKERSPLNRCVLAQDISGILQRGVKTLVVDLDLSPLLGESAEEAACQKQLNNVLDGAAKQLVLLVPFFADSEKLRAVKHAWMHERCNAALVFAVGDLEKSLGIVIDTRYNSSGVPELVEKSGESEKSEKSEICAELAAIKNSPEKNRWLKKPEENAAVKADQPHNTADPINFRKFAHEAIVTTTGDPRLDLVTNWKSRVVFFGGSYGTDDTFLTSMGELPGVAIHAARWVTHKSPVKELNAFAGFSLDLLLGALFMFVVKNFWGRYVVYALDPNPTLRELKNWCLAGFLLIYLMLTLVAFALAQWLFISFGVLIAPLLIAVSMLVDGFISGPINAFSAREESGIDEVSHKTHAPVSKAQSMLSKFAYFSKAIVFWATVTSALWVLSSQ